MAENIVATRTADEAETLKSIYEVILDINLLYS